VLATKGQSVIEEKGEGFENGKNVFGWLGVPSTSFTLPIYVLRLKMLDYKSVAHSK
jgi:hypothetical protein